MTERRISARVSDKQYEQFSAHALDVDNHRQVNTWAREVLCAVVENGISLNELKGKPKRRRR